MGNEEIEKTGGFELKNTFLAYLKDCNMTDTNVELPKKGTSLFGNILIMLSLALAFGIVIWRELQ